MRGQILHITPAALVAGFLQLLLPAAKGGAERMRQDSPQRDGQTGAIRTGPSPAAPPTGSSGRRECRGTGDASRRSRVSRGTRRCRAAARRRQHREQRSSRCRRPAGRTPLGSHRWSLARARWTGLCYSPRSIVGSGRPSTQLPIGELLHGQIESRIRQRLGHRQLPVVGPAVHCFGAECSMSVGRTPW
jgi:hypothetical protein